MSEEGADFALWGDETEAVEDELDIPADLRSRMKAWAKEDSAHERHGVGLDHGGTAGS